MYIDRTNNIPLPNTVDLVFILHVQPKDGFLIVYGLESLF